MTSSGRSRRFAIRLKNQPSRLPAEGVMKRRSFLGAALSGTPVVAQQGQTGPPVQGLLPLAQLRDQYRYDLFEDYLPFLDRYVIDRQYGGFMCETDRDGRNLSGRKVTWYEGRGIWVYSFLHNHFGRQKHHLEVARRSVEFILAAKPEGEDTLWPVSFARDGKPETPPATAIYGDLFDLSGRKVTWYEGRGIWVYSFLHNHFGRQKHH